MDNVSAEQSVSQQKLQDFVARELAQPVNARVQAMAEAVRRPFGDAAVAVLFYGSCLRQPEAQLADSLLDFYVLVDDYRRAYPTPWLAWANQLLPPNVFYLERSDGQGMLRAKYAVISLRQFQHGTGPAAPNVSLWARFCQPARLIWSRDTASAAAAAAACAQAVLTMLGTLAHPALDGPEASPALDGQAVLRLWTAGFQATYRAEVRPEGVDRAAQIVAADAARYQAITPLAHAVLRDRPMREGTNHSWRRNRLLGKLFNIARLIKGAFTFEGGLDYALWKIARHSGVTVEVTPWQRRHPLLAAPRLAWRLYRRGAFR